MRTAALKQADQLRETVTSVKAVHWLIIFAFKAGQVKAPFKSERTI